MAETNYNPTLFGEALLEAIRLAVRQELLAVMGGRRAGVDGALPGNHSETARPYLTVKEAAVMTGLAPATIRLYIRKRQLKAHRVGRRVLIKQTDLQTFVEASPARTAAG